MKLQHNLMVPGANLAAYVQSVGRIPILTLDQERELSENLFYRGDVDAARQLVLSHLRFVIHIAKSYSGYGLSESDLIQEGNVGLMKAVKRFNPEKGVRLVSFAVHWIKAEIHEFILRNWRIVKVATTKAQRKLFFNLRSAKKTLAWFSAEEAKKVANDLGVGIDEVYRMESRLSGADIPFDLPSDTDDDEGFQAPQLYLQDRSTDPSRLIESADLWNSEREGLYLALDDLDERSKDIIVKRWLREPKTTLQDLAAEHAVSAERIRQLEKLAIEKVRKSIELKLPR